MRKFVFWTDLHYGYEWVMRGGKRVREAVHCEKTLKAAMEFLEDFKPDVFILGGDNLNMGFASRWNQGKPRLVEGFRGKEDYDEFNKQVLLKVEALLPQDAIKIWMYGNHEQWIQQFIDQNPTFEGLLEPEKYLGLKERGWKILSQGEIYMLGKLRFIHGDVLLRSEGGYVGGFPAKKAVVNYGKTIRLGHCHTYQVFARKVSAEDGFSTGMCVPGMCKRSPDYVKNAPNAAIQGFLFGYVLPNGQFSDYPVIVYKGRFVWNGKEYGK